MYLSTKDPAEMTGQERIDEVVTLLAGAFLRIVRSETDLTGHLKDLERSYDRSGSRRLNFVQKTRVRGAV